MSADGAENTTTNMFLFLFPGAGDKTLAIDRDKENEGDATDSEISMMSAEIGIIR